MILTEEQYKYICSSCDKLLTESKDSVRIANDWLHVMRPHPIYFKKYEHIFHTKGSLITLIYILKNMLIYSAKILLNISCCSLSFLRNFKTIARSSDSLIDA